MSDYSSEAPIAWEVCAVSATKTFVDGYKLEPYRRRFATKTEADQCKAEMQRKGWVATATPVYLDRKVRKVALHARQSEPFGRFNADWKLAL